MALQLSLNLWGYTQICVARGTVSWRREDNDAAGELQFWFDERDNDYCLYAYKTARDDMAVCKVMSVIDVVTLHFQNQNVINEEVEISFRPILKTNSTM